MTKAGKKYTDAAKLIEAGKAYTPKEAVELVKKTSVTKFDSTVECSVRLGVDPKYADQQVRGALVLPMVLVNPRLFLFCPRCKAQEAQDAGADFVGAEELADKIKGAGSTLTSA